jgi:hypothetical protein
LKLEWRTPRWGQCDCEGDRENADGIAGVGSSISAKSALTSPVLSTGPDDNGAVNTAVPDGRDICPSRALGLVATNGFHPWLLNHPTVDRTHLREVERFSHKKIVDHQYRHCGSPKDQEEKDSVYIEHNVMLCGVPQHGACHFQTSTPKRSVTVE